MKAVIDSDVLIDYLQGVDAARTELARYQRPCYSIISWLELHCGARTDAESRAVDSLLATMERIDLTEPVARKAVAARRKWKLKLPDAIIFASAEEADCLLVTRNTRDFPEDNVRLRFPYTI